MNHSDIDTDIQRTEEGIKTFEEAKKLAEAVAKLRNNKDFKLVVEQGYFTKYLNNLVQGLAIVSTEANVNQMNRQIAGIGSFKHYLNTIEHQGLIAEQEIINLKNALNTLRMGEVSDE